MAVLSDRDIRRFIDNGRIIIDPFHEDMIGPSSVDLHLDSKFRIFKHTETTHIDPNHYGADDVMDMIEVPEGKPFVVHPGEFVLSNTKEYIRIPEELVARLDGRSSLGRIGIIVHSTAGAVDPGFEGQLVLEISNISKIPVCLWPGSRVCRLTFDTLTSPSEKPYYKQKDKKYLGQKGPEASKISLEKDLYNEE